MRAACANVTGMRIGGGSRRASAAIATVLLLSSGCATPGAPAATPTPSPSPSAPARPPLASDLTGGVPVNLGGATHWAIRDGRAFLATTDGVEAIDLATGATAWRAAFEGSGVPWDSTATVGFSSDGATLHALRTVDTPAGAALELLSVTADTGAIVGNRQVEDPQGQWRVDLPPRILTADATSLVLADNPESGAQVGVVDLPTATMLWSADDQAMASNDLVITRSGARDLRTGAPLWQASFRIGPFLGWAGEQAVVGDAEAGRVVWLDAARGTEAAAAPGDPDLCVTGASVLVCPGEKTRGYDLVSGEQLWSGGEGNGLATYRDWVYLWRTETRGDVLDGRTGEVLVADGELPRIRYSDASGVLVETDGLRWVMRD